MTEQNIKDYENATKCWICEQEITKNNPKVRDHCHFTGEYRGAAHKSCNLKLKIKPGKTKIPVVFHNLKGYDSHLIMQKIHKSKGNITCISNNAEKYISFSIQSGSQGSESVQYFHNDLSRAILVSIITSISQIPIMVPLSVYVSELLPVLQ